MQLQKLGAHLGLAASWPTTEQFSPGFEMDKKGAVIKNVTKYYNYFRNSQNTNISPQWTHWLAYFIPKTPK